MVGIDGKIVAEPNDPNTVHVPRANNNQMVVGLDPTGMEDVFGVSGKSIVMTGSKGLLHTNVNGGSVTSTTLSANKYLCTDANGNLIFKEL